MQVHCKYDEMWSLDRIEKRINPANRNEHPPEQIEAIIEQFKYQGIRHPIIISNRSDRMVAGEGRFLAAKKMGLKEFPVSLQDFLNPEQEYAFGIADNAIASWSELDLKTIEKDIEALSNDFDISLLGIENFELEKEEDKEEDEHDSGPKAEPRSRRGDIFVLAGHRLMCGDSTDESDVKKLMNGNKADMVFTDPPYGMDVVKPDGNISGNRVGKNGYGKKGQYDKKAKCGIYRPIIGDDKPFDPSHLFEIAPLQIIWGANHFSDKLPTSPHWIVWNKEMPAGTDFSGAELAWTNIDKKAVKVYKFTWAGMTREGDRKDELESRIHPTQKPVGLFAQILNDYEPESVVDLFLGSGSTLIACEKTNRKCYGMEIDPRYCDVILNRWAKYTGKDPVRHDGKLWSQVKNENSLETNARPIAGN